MRRRSVIDSVNNHCCRMSCTHCDNESCARPVLFETALEGVQSFLYGTIPPVLEWDSKDENHGGKN